MKEADIQISNDEYLGMPQIDSLQYKPNPYQEDKSREFYTTKMEYETPGFCFYWPYVSFVDVWNNVLVFNAYDAPASDNEG